jgi:hypothetical protein
MSLVLQVAQHIVIIPGFDVANTTISAGNSSPLSMRNMDPTRTSRDANLIIPPLATVRPTPDGATAR